MSLGDIRKKFYEDLDGVSDAKSLEEIRVRYLGRERGELIKILRTIKDLPLEEKKKIGPEANALRMEIGEAIEKKLADFLSSSDGGGRKMDISMPGKKITVGHLHPLTLVEKKIRDIFNKMNFTAINGPEIETEYYNFDALNIPADHPARDMWDTFWLKSRKEADKNANERGKRLLLRTHTSPVQIRYMEKNKPPFQIICPGRVFRYEAIDSTHEINFYQVEGLMVGQKVSLANFKYVIESFFNKFFGKSTPVRFRPSYFPFVEPGLEIDIKLKGEWLEVMGAGMVHRRVFEAAHYNPDEWRGFAFGMGLERLAMIKYNIPDIRLFYSGDARFVSQFK